MTTAETEKRRKRLRVVRTARDKLASARGGGLKASGLIPLPPKPKKSHTFGDLPPNVQRMIASKMTLRDATRLSAVDKTTRSAIAANLKTRTAQQARHIERARKAAVDLMANKIYPKVVHLINRARRMQYNFYILDVDPFKHDKHIHTSLFLMPVLPVPVNVMEVRIAHYFPNLNNLSKPLQTVKIKINLHRNGSLWVASVDPHNPNAPQSLLNVAAKVADMLNQKRIHF